jgi:hypothetical protein
MEEAEARCGVLTEAIICTGSLLLLGVSWFCSGGPNVKRGGVSQSSGWSQA